MTSNTLACVIDVNIHRLLSLYYICKINTMVKSKKRSPKRDKTKGSKLPERGNKPSSNNTASSTASEQDNHNSPARNLRSGQKRASPALQSSSPSEPKSTGRGKKQSSGYTPSSALKFQSPLPSTQTNTNSPARNNNSPAGRTRSIMSRITTSQDEAVDTPVQASDVNQSTNPNSDHNVNVDEDRDPTAANNAGNRDEFNVLSPLSENKSNATLPGDVSGGDPSSSLPGGETTTPPPKKDDTLLPSPVNSDVNLQHCKFKRITINNTMLPFVYPLYINEKNDIVCSITDTNHNRWDTQTQIRIMMTFLGDPYDRIDRDKKTNTNTGPGDDMEVILLPRCDNHSIWNSIDDVATINAEVRRPLLYSVSTQLFVV